MIIKRYIVDNMNEAMTKIRYELGSEAVIVSQRKIRQKGITGIFKAKKIEVTAAVDEKSKKAKEAQSKDENLKKEIDELKTMMQSIVSQNTSPNEKKKDGSRNKFKQKLVEKDIPDDVIEDLYNIVKTRNGDKKLSPKANEKEIVEIINDLIKVDKEENEVIEVNLYI
jgi:flagellar biosynthesis protein FlhF